jgi:flagellar hook-associated protein 3 FlgL
MTTSGTLLDINRNVSRLDGIERRIAASKNILRPSDDPIIAARALKFRSNVAEAEQYQKNIEQGLSWMDTTDRAFFNVVDILDKIRVLANQGATGTNAYASRKAIADDVEQLAAQLGKEMNATYVGRYVFSGFRTDEPLVFERGDSKEYLIEQAFYESDVETTKALQRVVGPMANDDRLKMSDVNILKMAYANSGAPTVSISSGGLVVTPTVTEKSLAAADVYEAFEATPVDYAVTFIKETGELVLGDNAKDFLEGGVMTVRYEKNGFLEGDLNPIVNFRCRDLQTGLTYNMDDHNLEYEFAVNTRVGVNTLGKDVYTDKLHANLRAFVNFVKNVAITDEKWLKTKFAQENPSFTEEQVNAAVHKKLADEKQRAEKSLRDRFNNLIGVIGESFSSASARQADLGARMDRLNVMSNRIKSDIINFKELLSSNEDIDIAEAGIELSVARAAYDASLQVGAKVMRLTLADYIR